MISVSKIDEVTFDVTVEGTSTTTHRVTVANDVLQRLTAGSATPEQLVRVSFDFLLQREPNTSILRQFELPLIGSYFPEYEGQMKSRFA